MGRGLDENNWRVGLNIDGQDGGDWVSVILDLTQPFIGTRMMKNKVLLR